jgi:hypothetical protein
MLPTNVQELKFTNIQSLLDNEVAENLTLEYKQGIPTGQGEEKKELLFDFAATANPAGPHRLAPIPNDLRFCMKQAVYLSQS